MFIQSFLIVLISFRFVDGICQFHANDANDREIQKRFTNFKTYGNIFNISDGKIIYQIGICKEISSSNTTAIIQQDGNVTRVLGRLDHVNLVQGDGWIYLTYENGDPYENICDNRRRSASLMFICGSKSLNPKAIELEKNDGKTCAYLFQVEVSELCPNVPVEKMKLSGGAIFIIILLSLVTVYFIAGFFYMRVKRGARGIDQIPNLDFWRQLAFLAADGCDLCCRCNKATPRSGYFLDESGADLRGDDDILAP